MFKPDFITFTGADDATDTGAMAKLAGQYPVEYGILFSRSREGNARYPGRAFIEKVSGSGLRLAAHVCGAWATQIIEEGASDVDDRFAGFGRVQINTGLPLDIDKVLSWRDRVEKLSGVVVEPILQCRDLFPEDPRVSWLYDPSGGRGVEPGHWPACPADAHVRFGYAGGIGPLNVLSVLSAIPAGHGGWIDMESRVRDAEDRFSLGLCADVCVTVYGDGA